MKKIVLIIVLLQNIISWSQVGIGTTNPQEELEVNGSIRMTDGNQDKNKIMVSDVNGTAAWKNVNDGVKTRIINLTNQGTGEVIVWTHPENIEVRFIITGPNNDTVTVENKSTDATHYWNVVITGGAISRNNIENVKYKANYIRDDGSNDMITFDLGANKTGWFKIICTDQNNEKDGFTLNIMFYDDNLNGIVQYWDN